LIKTLGKFKINPEKIINNEELVNLKGGYACTVECYSGSTTYGYLLCDQYDCS